MAFLFGGIVVCIINEVIYTLTNFSHAKIYTAIIDIICVFIFAAGLAIFARIINFGEIRLYSLISYTIGYFLCNKILGKHFQPLKKAVYNQISRLFKDKEK